MARHMSAVRLAQEIDRRVAEHGLEADKVTLAEFKETLVQSLWTDQVEVAARKQEADSNRGKGDEAVQDEADPPPPDDDAGDDDDHDDDHDDEAPF